MTIDEAIKLAEEIAKKQENIAKRYPRPNKSVKGSGIKYNAYLKCAEEHRQLAEWLRDYKRLLEQQPCTDAISRQAVLELVADYDLSMGQVVKGIHALSSVTPVEKPSKYVAPDVLNHWIGAEVLDRIREEFISLYPKNYAGEPELGGSSCEFSLNKVLNVIDKYKPESEG